MAARRRSRAPRSAPEEVPLAIDELPLVALLGAFAEGETVVRGAGELRVKESDRIAGVVDGPARPRRRHRGDRRRLRRPRRRRAAARRHDRRPRRPPHGDARRGRRPGLAEGVEVVGHGGRRRLLPRLRGTTCAQAGSDAGRTTPARASPWSIAIDGPAGAGKSTVRAAVARGARLHLPRLGRDVPRRRAARCSRRRAASERAGELEIALGERVIADGRDVTEAIRTPRGLRGRVAGWPPTQAVRAALVEQAARADRGRRLGRRGPRHRHRRRARRRAEGLPHRRARRSARAAAPTSSAPTSRPSCATRRCATSRTARASTRRCEPADDAVEVDTTGLHHRRGRRADRRACARAPSAAD